ncbi:LamB/YcsF family protein [Mycobacteroides abscessus subsp. abscessus]|nr:LamB/YcsF family protein [Mycobacteroides abscessus subsp. abscessus]
MHARAVVDAIAAVDPALPVLGLPGSLLLEIASDRGIGVVREAFADRAYHSDGTLVSRREPGAVLDDPTVVAGRVLRMVSDGVVDSVEGDTIRIDVDSVCLHGDSPAAVAMAVATRELLTAEGIEITPFS